MHMASLSPRHSLTKQEPCRKTLQASLLALLSDVPGPPRPLSPLLFPTVVCCWSVTWPILITLFQ